MKIGILSQPLYNNYGGLLQSFALLNILKDLGHDVWIIDRDYSKISFISRLIYYTKYFISHYFLRHKQSYAIPLYLLTEREKKIISKYTHQFVNTYLIPRTSRIYTNAEIRKVHSYNFQSLIVGSDQVWRPAYSPNIYNYFLDFVPNNKVKKISYAASFGVDYSEYSTKQISIIKPLIKQFVGISVREESGIKLCNQLFDVNKVIQVLDPTLLYSGEYYNLMFSLKEYQCENILCSYILDMNDDKKEDVEYLADQLNLKIKSNMPKETLTMETRSQVYDCVFPSVESWMKDIYNSQFVITDSFHGTVFSILFHKPFIVLINPGRGISRIKSLLSMFNLDNRIVDTKQQINLILNDSINWESVERILVEQRKKSMQFLITNLDE